jgi:hypothetical protein
MARRRGKAGEYFNCPCCGAEVPVGAKFCRECGASDESGWGEDESQDEESSTGYRPDDDFDYDEFVSREFPNQSPFGSKQRVKRWAMAVLVAIVAAAFLASVLLWG